MPLRLLTFLALFSLVVAPSCADHSCDPDGLARNAAGANASNCGTVAIGADRAAVDACVMHAFAAHQPFYARYDEQGIDSKLAYLVAGDASGRIFTFNWDGDPSGGSKSHETVDQYECRGPSVNADGTQITC